MTCPVEGCSKEILRGGYCYGHYMKNWRYGTPTPQHRLHSHLEGKRFGSLIVERFEGGRWICRCDCGAITLSSAGELNRGSKISCGDSRIHHRQDCLGYGAAHDRVRHDRGPADSHTCVDCGGPARHWSYNHDDPDELYVHGKAKRPVAYSADPSHYSPRCVSCHKAFDLGRLNAATLA